MRVYNLSKLRVIYKGRVISPNGGFLDYPTLTFIPDRDRELEKAKVLAFGSLPAGWSAETSQPAPQPDPKHKPGTVTFIPVHEEVRELTHEESSESKGKTFKKKY